ncbi:MAG: enoyl-CoA hydratase/isomerase family protein [Pseudomonadales bacterium]|nr:enoyl-CoA hydratase/isomerase family protein [Pseudomonadales bacterium]
MSKFGDYLNINVDIDDDYVATVEMDNGELNHFDMDMLISLADCFDDLDKEASCRVLLLCSTGRAFSAGANFQGGSTTPKGLDNSGRGHLYDQAVRLFSNKKPIVAAVNGAAIGGGLGLALVPDFRVACPEARFSANFTRLAIHPGFGLSYTLPKLIGQQHAYDMFYTGRRVKGEEAHSMGLVDRLVPKTELLAEAHSLAKELAISAPLAIVSLRETLRKGLPEMVKAATDRELSEQNWLFKSADAKEGVVAMAERRNPNFSGK